MRFYSIVTLLVIAASTADITTFAAPPGSGKHAYHRVPDASPGKGPKEKEKKPGFFGQVFSFKNPFSITPAGAPKKGQ
ncbi:hypothetical protein FRC02_008993 [Tulasnella sp. 418]|nr:hypothetical protein FRC02_008993 [Tulasnella sp. 418]